MVAVAHVGTRQGTYSSESSGSITPPSGSAAGHLAVLEIEAADNRIAPSGWVKVLHTDRTDVWWKKLTADDLSGIDFTGNVAWLSVYSGAGRCRRSSHTGQDVTPGGRTTVAGSMLHFWWRGYHSPLTPSGAKLGADVRDMSYRKRYSNVANSGPHAAPGYHKLSGGSNVLYSDAFEIMPLTGPNAPTLTSPAWAAEVDYSEALTLSWLHNSTQDVAQQARQVDIREVGAGSWSSLAADGTIGATVTVATTDTTATVDAGQLTSGTDYEWRVKTEDVDVWSAWSAVSTFTAPPRPTVTSITVTAPAEDISPVVALTVATTSAHMASRVRICAAGDADASSPLYDSGVLPGAVLTAYVPAHEWTNGQSLRAWVMVRQAVLWSLWTADDATFAVTWTPPTAPSSVTAALGTPPVVTVAGVSGADRVQVQASTDGGTSWAMDATVTPSGSSVQVIRPRRYGVPVTFRARSAVLGEAGVPLWSAWTTMAGSITPDDPAAYLEAEDGTGYLGVIIAADENRVRTQDFAVSYPLSDAPDAAALVDSTPARGWSGRTTYRCWSQSERDALLSWLDAHPKWWRHMPPERDKDGAMVAEAPILAAVANPLSLARLAQVQIQYRDVPVDWVSQ